MLDSGDAVAVAELELGVGLAEIGPALEVIGVVEVIELLASQAVAGRSGDHCWSRCFRLHDSVVDIDELPSGGLLGYDWIVIAAAVGDA